MTVGPCLSAFGGADGSMVFVFPSFSSPRSLTAGLLHCVAPAMWVQVFRLLVLASVELRADTPLCSSTGVSNAMQDSEFKMWYEFFSRNELYVFAFAGNQTVVWSRVRQGGGYVPGQTQMGPGARLWAGRDNVIRCGGSTCCFST